MYPTAVRKQDLEQFLQAWDEAVLTLAQLPAGLREQVQDRLLAEFRKRLKLQAQELALQPGAREQFLATGFLQLEARLASRVRQ